MRAVGLGEGIRILRDILGAPPRDVAFTSQRYWARAAFQIGAAAARLFVRPATEGRRVPRTDDPDYLDDRPGDRAAIGTADVPAVRATVRRRGPDADRGHEPGVGRGRQPAGRPRDGDGRAAGPRRAGGPGPGIARRDARGVQPDRDPLHAAAWSDEPRLESRRTRGARITGATGPGTGVRTSA